MTIVQLAQLEQMEYPPTIKPPLEVHLVADPKIDITVVVNGQPTVVTANPNAPLHTIIPKALAQTNTTGQPPENWELNYEGQVLDVDRKIETFNFPPGVQLFLNLKAGIGGDR